MSADEFHFLDDTTIDNSIVRDFFKMYHQQNAQLNESDKIEFIFRENNNFYHIGIGWLHFDIQFKKDGGKFEDDNTDVIRSVKIEFAHIFKKTKIQQVALKSKAINLLDKLLLLHAC